MVYSNKSATDMKSAPETGGTELRPIFRPIFDEPGVGGVLNRRLFWRGRLRDKHFLYGSRHVSERDHVPTFRIRRAAMVGGHPEIRARTR